MISKLFASILFLALLRVNASQPTHNQEIDTKLRGRRLISFNAFNKLISEGGADIARDGSSTGEPITTAASEAEAPTTSPPTASPTKSPSKNPTNSPTGMPATDAPTTSSPTDYSPTTSSPSTSAPTTSEPTEVPSLALSNLPTTSEPTKSPTIIPTTSKPTTTEIPISSPTTKPSTSTPQNGIGSTRTSSISLQIKGETASNGDTLDSICNVTQTYVNTVTKRSFGKSTVTTVDCNDVSMGHVHATTKTEFPNDIQAPDAITYDDYIHVVMTSDETISTLPTKISEVAASLADQEVKASVDTSVNPPVLQLSFEELQDSAAMMRSSFTVGATMILVITASMT